MWGSMAMAGGLLSSTGNDRPESPSLPTIGEGTVSVSQLGVGLRTLLGCGGFMLAWLAARRAARTLKRARWPSDRLLCGSNSLTRLTTGWTCKSTSACVCSAGPRTPPLLRVPTADPLEGMHAIHSSHCHLHDAGVSPERSPITISAVS